MSDVTTCIKGTEKAAEQSMDAIRLLDMAIIVAGATRPNRMDWIQRAIALVQSIRENEIFYQDATPTTLSRPAKRTKVHDPAVLSFAPTSVPVLATPPSLENYLVHHREKPFILPGYLSTASDHCPPWPAISKWADPDYLLSRVGRGRWVPVEEGSAYDDRSWGQRIVPFEDFLRRAGFALDETDSTPIESRPMYLAQHSLFRQFPNLERDVVIPDYAWSNPAAPIDSPAYRPPLNEDGLIVNVWIGSGSGEIVSPAHTVSLSTVDLGLITRIHTTIATLRCWDTSVSGSLLLDARRTWSATAPQMRTTRTTCPPSTWAILRVYPCCVLEVIWTRCRANSPYSKSTCGLGVWKPFYAPETFWSCLRAGGMQCEEKVKDQVGAYPCGIRSHRVCIALFIHALCLPHLA